MRSEHEFSFPATEIAAAASTEAEYHEHRQEHWTERRERALERVKATVGAKVVEREITGGKTASVEVTYGDPEAWQEYQLAYQKVNEHRAEAERFRTDERLYGTQGSRQYSLNSPDVHHFRLDGQPRIP